MFRPVRPTSWPARCLPMGVLPLWTLAYLINTKSLCCTWLRCQCHGRGLGRLEKLYRKKSLAENCEGLLEGIELALLKAVLSALMGTLTCFSSMGVAAESSFSDHAKVKQKTVPLTVWNVHYFGMEDITELLSSLCARLEGIFCPVIPNRSHSKTRSVSKYPSNIE